MVTIKVGTHGSVRVEGPEELVDHGGNLIEPPNQEFLTLGRRGHSANKPLCDRTEKRVGFDGEQ